VLDLLPSFAKTFPRGCFSPFLATKGDHKDVFILSVLTARNSAARRGSFHFISRPFIYLSNRSNFCPDFPAGESFLILFHLDFLPRVRLSRSLSRALSLAFQTWSLVKGNWESWRGMRPLGSSRARNRVGINNFARSCKRCTTFARTRPFTVCAMSLIPIYTWSSDSSG